MKVIFLDVDGVLNFSMTEAKAPSGAVGVVDSCVKKLKKIIDNTNSFIILVSSWKNEWNMDEEKAGKDGKYLIKKLERRGLHIMDKTTDKGSNRGEGIDEWLKRHPNVTDWIVLDDDYFPDYKEFGIDSHLIQTSYVVGLTDSHVDKAIDFLNGYINNLNEDA